MSNNFDEGLDKWLIDTTYIFMNIVRRTFMSNEDWPHRTYCDTLAEMRKILKYQNRWTYKRDKEVLQSLIEECQMYGNRMEAALDYGRDLQELHQRRKELLKEVETIEKCLPKKEEE